jgi:ureidoglycolate hydrolase
MRTVPLAVSPLIPEMFAPYGEVLAVGHGEPDFTGISSAGWRAHFESDSPPEVMVYRSRYSGPRFTTLERHHAVTQAFIPLAGVPALVAVAPPTDGDDPPDPSVVRGFILDGTAGYILQPGAWHSPDRYPLYPPHASVVIITDRATQAELERRPGGPWTRTQAVDYAIRFGVVFEFRL